MAFSIFRKWRDEPEEPTLLRVDAEIGVTQFSVECTVARVDEPSLSLLLDDCGFMELRFDETWTFEFLASDAERVDLDERIAESPLGTRLYEFGEAVVVRRKATGVWFIFLEIVRRVGLDTKRLRP